MGVMATARHRPGLHRAWLVLIAIAVVALAVLIFGPQRGREEYPAAPATIELMSEVFVNNGRIPERYTCDGGNVSPPLSWEGVPAEAKSLVLIVVDPDAPGGEFTHWVLYDVPPDLSGLPEGVPAAGEVEGIGVQGVNDFGRLGYGGPCPPPGKAHRYFFRLYALDVKLGLAPGASRSDVEDAMSGHVLAVGELVGLYERG